MSGKKLIDVTDFVQDAEKAENQESQSQKTQPKQSPRQAMSQPSDIHTIYKVSPVYRRLADRVKAFVSPKLFAVVGQTRLVEFLDNTRPDILLRLRTIYLIPELPKQSPSSNAPLDSLGHPDPIQPTELGRPQQESTADDAKLSGDPEPCHLDPVIVSRLLCSYQLTTPDNHFIIGLIVGAILTIAIGAGAFFLEPLL